MTELTSFAGGMVMSFRGMRGGISRGWWREKESEGDCRRQQQYCLSDDS